MVKAFTPISNIILDYSLNYLIESILPKDWRRGLELGLEAPMQSVKVSSCGDGPDISLTG